VADARPRRNFSAVAYICQGHPKGQGNAVGIVRSGLGRGQLIRSRDQGIVDPPAKPELQEIKMCRPKRRAADYPKLKDGFVSGMIRTGRRRR